MELPSTQSSPANLPPGERDALARRWSAPPAVATLGAASTPASETSEATPARKKSIGKNWTKLQSAVLGGDDENCNIVEAARREQKGETLDEVMEHCPSFIWPKRDPSKSFCENWCKGNVLPLMHPDGRVRFRWDILQVLSLVYVSVVVRGCAESGA